MESVIKLFQDVKIIARQTLTKALKKSSIPLGTGLCAFQITNKHGEVKPVIQNWLLEAV